MTQRSHGDGLGLQVLGALLALVHPVRLADQLDHLGLLFESGLESGLDAIVVVWVPVELQFKRAVERGMAGADVRARIKSQMPIDDKRDRATDVVDNSGDRQSTKDQVNRLWARLVEPGVSTP